MWNRSSRRGASALAASMVLVSGAAGLAACTGGGSGQDVVVDADTEARAFDLAADSSYGVAQGGQGRVTADGVRLEVLADYFEPLRLGDWTAPDECAFNTRVQVTTAFADSASTTRATSPFEGPTADQDAGTSGALGTVVVRDGLGPSVPRTTSVDLDDGAEGLPPGASGIADHGGGEVTSTDDPTDRTIHDDLPPSTTTAPRADAPPVDPSTTTTAAPSSTPSGTPSTDGAVALVVVAFAHGSVATLHFTEPVDGSPFAAVDTQPADGWTPLALVVPVERFEARDLPPLQLEIASGDLVRTTDIDLGSLLGPTDPTTGQAEDVQVLTDDWRFDAAQVGDQCAVPDGPTTPDNTPRPADADIVGRSIRPAPELPPAGEQPADPTDATAQVLDAIRTVYDIGDVYDEGKAARTEDPAVAARIFDDLRKNKVIEPYLSNLDPVFGAVVFTSPDEAAVVYRVGPSYQWEIGRVRSIDGEWKLAIGTLCRDLGDAAYSCPGVVPDGGPGPLG